MAIDTKKTYKEINLEKLAPKKLTWDAPHKSDWAIALGRFKR